MLHFLHQQVAKFVCLLFGDGKVAYSKYLQLFCWKQLPAAVKNITNSYESG